MNSYLFSFALKALWNFAPWEQAGIIYHDVEYPHATAVCTPGPQIKPPDGNPENSGSFTPGSVWWVGGTDEGRKSGMQSARQMASI